MKVAIYGRVSTSDGRQSTDNQLITLREFCDKQAWTVSTEYVDEASGSRSDRPQFQKMFSDASRHRFDMLLFFSLDRLSREGVLQTLTYLNRLTEYGIAWRSYTEQYLDSTGIFKDAVIGILAAIAKQEKVRISERTKAGLERARRRGSAIGRPRVSVDTAQLQELRREGLSWMTIQSEYGIKRSTAQRALANARQHSKPERKDKMLNQKPNSDSTRHLPDDRVPCDAIVFNQHPLTTQEEFRQMYCRPEEGREQ